MLLKKNHRIRGEKEVTSLNFNLNWLIISASVISVKN